jgi:multiple sugar transport system permease protein
MMKENNLSLKRYKISETFVGYGFALPALLVVAFVMFYPVFFTVRLSLLDYTLQFNKQEFIGLANYRELFHDSEFIQSIAKTFKFTVSTVCIEFALGLMIALFSNMNFKGNAMLRTVMLIPWAIPTVISTVLWKFMLNDQFGVINFLLVKCGFADEYVSWLASPTLAMNCAIMIDAWKTTPFVFILLLAGLQVIPKEEYEAASIDGASLLQRFGYITLPELSKTIFITLLFRTMDAFRVFDMIVNLTNGGPGNATEFVTLRSYKTIFRNLDIGYGSAMSVIIFIIIMLFSIVYLLLMMRDQKKRG